jgi:hypothetical protein
MQTQNGDSSLTALRGLHEIEQRRQREGEQSRSHTERQRLAKAEAHAPDEHLTKELAEREAAGTAERIQTLRLGRELDTARTEIAHLRSELEKAYLAQTAIPSPPVRRGVRTLAWLGITAGVTMLVGAAALAAAMRPSDRPVAIAESGTAAAMACPRVEVPIPSTIAPKSATGLEPSPPKIAPKPRPAPAKGSRGGKGKPGVSAGCDPMRDPLCGIDGSVSDEAAKPRGTKHR